MTPPTYLFRREVTGMRKMVDEWLERLLGRSLERMIQWRGME